MSPDKDSTRSALPESEAGQQPSRDLTGVAPAAVWAFAFLILRIFAVSDYHWDTAFAVSTTLGIDDGLMLLFGSLLAGHVLVEILLACVLPLLIATIVWSPRGHQPTVLLSTAVGAVMMVAIVGSFRSWWLLGAVSVAVAGLALIQLLPKSGVIRRASALAMRRVGWVAAVAVLLAAALIRTPWVPHEQITTKQDTISGYVLSVDSGYLNVLTDDHEFVILLSSNVVARR